MASRVELARQRRVRTALRRIHQRAQRQANHWLPPRGTMAGPAVLRLLRVVGGGARSRGRATRRAFRWDRGAPPFYGRTVQHRRNPGSP